MSAGREPDIKLLFGVLGGTSTADGTSGGEIARTLQKIAESLEPIKIKVDVDKQSIEALKSKASEIKNITANVGKSIEEDTTKHVKNSQVAIDKYLTRALTQIEAMRHSLASSMVSAENYLSGNNVSKIERLSVEDQISDINSLYRSLDELKKQATSGEMTLKEFEAAISSLGLKIRITKNNLDEFIKTKRADLSATAPLVAGTKEYERASERMSSSMRKIVDAQKSYKDSILSTTRSIDISALKGYKEQIDKLDAKMKEGRLSQDEFARSMKQINIGVNSTIDSLAQYQTFGERLAGQFNSLSKVLLNFYTTHQIIMMGIRTIKDLINQSIELETAFSDTRIVTHATTEEIEKYSVAIANAAQATSTSINDLVSAATTFSRLGYSLEESATLAKFTGMLEKVGSVDTQQAEDAVTAILKAFPDEASVDNIERIMDKLVISGNNFPISVAQIAEGMTNASSAMAAAGNSFDQTVALLTAANATVQNASKASTALRTISARIRKTKTELDDLGEAMTESVYDNLINALTKHGVVLLDINNEFRSTYDIMKDIAAHWNEMTSMEQAAVAEAVAGTRQQTIFYSIIENFQEASGAMDAMAESAGSLSESYDVYLGTTKAHIQQFHTAWQALAKDLVDSGTIKGFVDAGTSILKLADSLQRAHLLIPAIISSINLLKGVQFAKSLITSRNAANGLVASLISLQKEQVTEGVITKSLEQEYIALTAAEKRATLAQLQEAAANGDAKAAHALNAMSVAGLTTAEEAAAASADALSLSLKGIATSNPLGWIMLAVSGIAMVIQKIKDAKEEVETTADTISRIKDEMSQLESANRSVVDQLRTLKASAKEVIPRYAELSEGVSYYRSNIDLTNEEYSEFINLNNKIAEILPDIVKGYDENGNAIIDLKDNADSLSKSLWDAVEAQEKLLRYDIANQMGESVFNAYSLSNAYKAKEQEAKNALEAAFSLRSELQAELDHIAADGKVYGGLSAETYLKLYDDISKVAPGISAIDGAMSNLFSNIYSMPTEDVISSITEMQESINVAIAQIQDSIGLASDAENDSRIWTQARQSAVALIQGSAEYIKSSPEIQTAIDEIVSTLDISKILKDAETDEYLGVYNMPIRDQDEAYSAVWTYLYLNVLSPVSEISSAVKDELSSALAVIYEFESGSYDVRTAKDAMSELTSSMKDAGMTADEIKNVFDLFGLTKVADNLEEIKGLISADTAEAEEFINTLSSKDLQLAYEILNENGSMSIDELKSALEDTKVLAEEAGEEIEDAFVIPEDFEEFFKDTNKITTKIDSMTSAMEKLKKGTNLTTKELVKMAGQYPELLKQSNLFTDKSAEGRRKLLNVMLEASKKEYDDNIDKKVAELNVDLEAVKKQIDLEKTKQQLRMQIYAKYLTGEIRLTSDHVNEISNLNAIATRNYAELKEGEVEVNRGALQRSNENTYSLLQTAIENIWSPYATDVGQLHIAIGRSGIQTTSEYVYATQQMLQALGWSITESIYNSISDANARSAIEQAAVTAYANMQGVSIDWLLDNYNSVYNENSRIRTNYSGSLRDLTQGYGSVSDWYQQESNASADFINTLEQAANNMRNEIDNLNGMRDLLTAEINDINNAIENGNSDSSSSSSSSSSDKSNPLLDEFNSWYKLQKHLQEMGDPAFDISKFIAELELRIKSLREQQAMSAEDAYKYEEEIAKAIQKFDDDAKNALNDLVQYRVKVIQEQRKTERDALNDRLSDLKDFYDKQKEMLRDQYNEEKYIKEQAEKRQAASDIQTQIDQLSGDNSSWAKKRIEELRVKLRDAEEDLSEFEREHALSQTESFLDDAYNKQAAEIQAAIDRIDESLNDPTALYNIALAEIKSNSSDIYEELRAFGEKNGDGVTNEAVSLITALADAIRNYENYQHERSLLIDGVNTSYNGYDGMNVPKGYASGTRNATRGIHRVDEEGAEALFESSDGNKYRMFSGGEKVLNASATEFLYAFAEAGAKLMKGESVIAGLLRSRINNQQIGSIHMGDIIINGRADEATLSEIRRAQRDNVSRLLNEFRRLK